MKQLIECVPNFSEGRDMEVIKQITDAIESVSGVKLLDVDPGRATNRTVVTFVGEPEAVIEGAFQGIKKASQLIDMSKHKGEHPRMGATDVCPLIPISNISMEETVKYAQKLGQKIGQELGIPIFLYEAAASQPDRQNLAKVRSGEYEGMANKLSHPEWTPDFGPAAFNAKSGTTAVGARDFLIAYNVNLNTKSVRRANSVAFDIREAGRIKREGNPITGPIVTDAEGNPERAPGTCKSVKGIGWYIEEYGLAQISMNLTDIKATSLHKAFEECCKSATSRGLRVTGSELVGLVPKKVMIDAGKYFLSQQGRSIGVDEEEIIHIAVKSLGLDELGPFDPQKKIIEYLLEDNDGKLISNDLTQFANLTASEAPAPGGGSISAYVGALGAALGTMVANLSAGKRGWDDRLAYFSDLAEQGQAIKAKLIQLVDEDTNAFNSIIEAIRMPKSSEKEKAARQGALNQATKLAIHVPLSIMKTSVQSYDLLRHVAETGNQNSLSDAGVGALCTHTAIRGAYMNVLINCKDFSDTVFVDDILTKAKAIADQSARREAEIVDLVHQKLA